MWHSRVSGFHLVNVRLGCGPRDEVRNGCAAGYHSRDLEGWPLRAISFESWANERILCVDRASSPPCAAVDVGSGLWAENVGGHTFIWRVTISVSGNIFWDILTIFFWGMLLSSDHFY